jgi:hypothetical protein
MAPLRTAAPELPKPSSGFAIVIGPRAALYRYADRPWADVLDAAGRGADGLRADTFGSATAHAADQEFVLREMVVGPSSVFHGYPALFEQRW